MKLRPPSIDPGVTSFLWAFGLALYLWLFMLAVGVDGATAAILAALSFFGIFLFVRLFGEEELPPYRARRARRRAGSQTSSSRERPR
ncbi:MAG: hypothetical protein M3321_11705 [Actinomycetota bacterium]|nr:hypothetical protein [Actinomycetota bacterium]